MLRVIPLLSALAVLAACGGGGGGTGGEIAFTVNRAGWGEIWLMKPDGSDRRRLTALEPANNDAAGSMLPAWSPDGTRIAFAAQIGTLEEDQRLIEIYVMRADGTERRRLTTNDDLDAWPSWSPDGKRIAFARVTEPGTGVMRGGIFVLAVDGGDEVQVTHPASPSLDGSSAWSPDGSSIAFARGGPGAGSFNRQIELYVVTPQGVGARKLTSDGGEPDWSPDGKRIAFTALRDRFGRTCFQECSTNGEIYVMDADGDDEQRLTKSGADDRSPAWSPDGRSIAFVSDRSNPDAHENEIYVMDADGAGVRRITRNDVWDLDPVWRP